MKIRDLMEAGDKLSAYLRKNSHHFQTFGDIYVFIWTDKVLSVLMKAGVKSNSDLRGVSTPGEIGLGIINSTTGDICVGAIDNDYDALWASSTDVSDFFVATGNRKLIRLPNRLQNLADMLKRAAEPVQEGGVDAIADYVEDNELEHVDAQAIRGMESVDEVKSYLEDERDKAEEELAKVDDERKELLSHAKELLRSGNKNGARELTKKVDVLCGDNTSIKIDINHLLKQKHLFVDSEDGEDGDVQDEIDDWTKNFQRDFPDLDIDDAREFSPT